MTVGSGRVGGGGASPFSAGETARSRSGEGGRTLGCSRLKSEPMTLPWKLPREGGWGQMRAENQAGAEP